MGLQKEKIKLQVGTRKMMNSFLQWTTNSWELEVRRGAAVLLTTHGADIPKRSRKETPTTMINPLMSRKSQRKPHNRRHRARHRHRDSENVFVILPLFWIFL
jgi:hypothetical protein